MLLAQHLSHSCDVVVGVVPDERQTYLIALDQTVQRDLMTSLSRLALFRNTIDCLLFDQDYMLCRMHNFWSAECPQIGHLGGQSAPFALSPDGEGGQGHQGDWTCSAIVSGLSQGAPLDIGPLGSGSSQGAACLSTSKGQSSSVSL
jgi:hypothetical protein